MGRRLASASRAIASQPGRGARRASNRRRVPPAGTPPPFVSSPSPRRSPPRPCCRPSRRTGGFRREPRPGSPTEDPCNGRTSDQVAPCRAPAIEQGAKGGIGLRTSFTRLTASTCCEQVDAGGSGSRHGAGTADSGGPCGRINQVRRAGSDLPALFEAAGSPAGGPAGGADAAATFCGGSRGRPAVVPASPRDSGRLRRQGVPPGSFASSRWA